MKIGRISAVVIGACLLQMQSYAQTSKDTLKLSREECISIALQESPTVKVANLEIKRLDYSKREVQANLFPTIDFTGAYQRSIELQTLEMSMGGASQQIKMGTDNNWNFGFSAAVPLVNASLWKSIKLSDIQILQAYEDSRASKLDLVDGINKAYYALMLAIDSRKVIQENYDLAKFNAEVYKLQYKMGTASEYDVLRSQVQVTNVEPELLQADIAVKQCQLQLKVLMGIDNNVTINPTLTLSEMQKEMFGYALDGNYSLNNNTSVRSLDIAQKLADENVTLQKYAWIPTLAATFNIAWSAMSNGNALRNQNFHAYSNVGVALQVPIFSGFGRVQKLRQAEVQVKELQLQKENLMNSLDMQVQLALDNINRQVKQISSSEAGMKQAAKALEIMKKSFEIGAATYLDLRDSEVANSSAHLAYLQSIYNYLISTSDLDLLLGREEAMGIGSGMMTYPVLETNPSKKPVLYSTTMPSLTPVEHKDTTATSSAVKTSPTVKGTATETSNGSQKIPVAKTDTISNAPKTNTNPAK